MAKILKPDLVTAHRGFNIYRGSEDFTAGPPSAARAETPVILTFTNDNPSKTKLLNDTKQVIYDIKPDFVGRHTITYMRKVTDGSPEGQIFGTIEWHETLPDKICFNQGKTFRTTSFFSGLAGLGSYSTSFKDSQGRKYTWKGLGGGLQLSLHAADTPDPNTPIAQFRKSRLDSSRTPPTIIPAQLVLANRAQEIQDLVVFTFLVLEKNRRSLEISEGSRTGMEGSSI